MVVGRQSSQFQLIIAWVPLTPNYLLLLAQWSFFLHRVNRGIFVGDCIKLSSIYRPSARKQPLAMCHKTKATFRDKVICEKYHLPGNGHLQRARECKLQLLTFNAIAWPSSPPSRSWSPYKWILCLHVRSCEMPGILQLMVHLLMPKIFHEATTQEQDGILSTCLDAPQLSTTSKSSRTE